MLRRGLISGAQPALMRSTRLAPNRMLHASRTLREDKNDERMIGPYPDVPFEYYNHRPQTVKYDDQQGRRNFGEPLHYQYDLIDVWSPDHFDSRPDSTATKWNLYFIGSIALFSAFCWYKWEDPQFVRRTYPYDGLNKALGGDENTKEIFAARSEDDSEK